MSDGLVHELLPWHSPPHPVASEQVVDRIVRAEPKLRAWTEYTVQGFALYTGANDALSVGLHRSGSVSQLANWYRQDVVLMTVMRVDSLFDRSAEISFQTVYRDLRKPGVREALVRHYVQSDLDIWSGCETDCTKAIDRFFERYRTIPWRVHGDLQHFRNLGLAHITYREVSRRISYAQLTQFVEIAADLAKEVSMMVRGLNIDHRRRMADIGDESKEYWLDAIRLGKKEEDGLLAGDLPAP